MTCSKIVAELLHNDLIGHMRSIPSLKLLVYELVLKLAEQSHSSHQLPANQYQVGQPLEQITMNRI